VLQVKVHTYNRQPETGLFPIKPTKFVFIHSFIYIRYCRNVAKSENFKNEIVDTSKFVAEKVGSAVYICQNLWVMKNK